MHSPPWQCSITGTDCLWGEQSQESKYGSHQSCLHGPNKRVWNQKGSCGGSGKLIYLQFFFTCSIFKFSATSISPVWKAFWFPQVCQAAFERVQIRVWILFITFIKHYLSTSEHYITMQCGWSSLQCRSYCNKSCPGMCIIHPFKDLVITKGMFLYTLWSCTDISHRQAQHNFETDDGWHNSKCSRGLSAFQQSLPEGCWAANAIS